MLTSCQKFITEASLPSLKFQSVIVYTFGQGSQQSYKVYELLFHLNNFKLFNEQRQQIVECCTLKLQSFFRTCIDHGFFISFQMQLIGQGFSSNKCYHSPQIANQNIFKSLNFYNKSCNIAVIKQDIEITIISVLNRLSYAP